MGGKSGFAVVFTSLLLLVAFLLAHLSSSPTYNELDLPRDARGNNAGACLMTYSSPSFLRLHSFGREYSRLGSGPWGLYLYREAGWDPDPFPTSGTGKVENGEDGLPAQVKLTGTPVIFVPGNAGSFRQARSLASTSTRLYYDLPGVRKKSALFPKASAGGRPLDWFALDFNDDFSAFHGQTLRDQAEYLADSIRYVLSLYHRQPSSRLSSSTLLPDPTSVIIVAHSMGGVVARAAILHPHYQANSISTLVTFATPHTVPPACIDSGIDAVYKEINSKWRESPPSDLALVSIGGGLSDTTISSESVSLSSLLPINHSSSFTVFASTLISTPVDHLAILWCSQILESLTSALIQIVDVRTSTGVIPLPNRLSILKDSLVGNLESSPSTPLVQSSTPSNLTFPIAIRLSLGERLSLRSLSLKPTPSSRRAYALPVPKVRTYASNKIFSLITSASVGRSKEAKIEVWACTSFTPSSMSPASPDESAQELEGQANQCTPLAPSHLSHLPASPHAASPAARLHPDERNPMQLVEIGSDGLAEEWIVVVVKSDDGSPDWAMAEWADGDKRTKIVEKSALQLLLSGYKVDAFPSSPTMVSELWFPALDSSLVIFSIKVFRSQCQETSSHFVPLLRSYSPLVYESTFQSSPASSPYTIYLHTHSSGPFQHPPLSAFAPSSSGGRLQIFTDPSCGGNDLAMEVKVDVWKTIGTWGIRWRMALVSVPFVVVLFVLCGQVSRFNNGHPYPSFPVAYSHLLGKGLSVLLVLITVFTLFQSILVSSSTVVNPWIQDALLGTRQTFFVLVPALVFLALTGCVAIEVAVLWLLVEGAAWIVKLITSRQSVAVEGRDSGDKEDTMPMPTQRLLSLALLLLVVLFFAPHQFAFLVLFLVHFGTTVRARLSIASSASISGAQDRFNYSFSILLLMLTLLPITALILVVWVRNLAVGWLAPFSSDHNVLQIVGFLVNVEQLQAGKMLQRSSGRITSTLSLLLFSFSALYALLYGVRYTHAIYPLGNLVSLWLAANNSDAFVLVGVGALANKRRRSIAISASAAAGGETSARKKGVVISRAGSPAIGSTPLLGKSSVGLEVGSSASK